MTVTPIKTARISHNQITLEALLDGAITNLPDYSVLAITSKVVSLCEGAVAPIQGVDKEALIQAESSHYLPNSYSDYGATFAVTQHTVILNAGIDESNGDGVYILWPRDPQATANTIRAYLTDRFGHQNVGVIITDSTCRPMRRGVTGVTIGFSGFNPVRSYVDTLDLFGRPFHAAHADIAGGLAAAAVLTMGEGAESTPLAVLSDLPFVEFTGANPTAAELATTQLTLENDLFAPFLTKAPWIPGRQERS